MKSIITIILLSLAVGAHARRPSKPVEDTTATETTDDGWSDSRRNCPCFRGKPKPDCCGFFLVECGIGRRVAQSRNSPDKSGLVLMADLGYMHNWRENSALGASIHMTVDDNGARWSMLPRYRYWMGRSVAADIKLGVIVASVDNTGEVTLPGLISGVSLSFGEWLSFDLLWELYRHRWTRIVYDPATFVHDEIEESGTASEVYASVTGRSTIGLVAATVIGVAFAVVFAGFEASPMGAR